MTDHVIAAPSQRADSSLPSATLPTIAISGAALTLVLLASLHFLSPEFDPSWRMVSEYALGKFGWLLSAFFLCWAVSSWALAAAIAPLASSWIARVGVALLVLSGIGEALAAYFDVSYSTMHGVAAMLGIPTVPIAAMLISHSRALQDRNGRTTVRLTAHLTWVAFFFMAAAMAVFISSYQQAGGSLNAATPPASLPEGTIAFNGWANRLLVISNCAWLIACASYLLNSGSRDR